MSEREIKLSERDLWLIVAALDGYAKFLEVALSDVHLQLTKRGRISRHGQRTESQMLRGQLIRRWEAAQDRS